MENHKNDFELNYIKIKNYLSANNGTNILKMSNDLNISTQYLVNLLSIWENNWNTFFEFGRIFSLNNTNVLNKKWFWISNNHSLARKQNLFYNNVLISDTFLEESPK